VPNALSRSAGDDVAGVNAQVEVIVRRALTEAGLVSRHPGPLGWSSVAAGA
jgi:hypothetical protein